MKTKHVTIVQTACLVLLLGIFIVPAIYQLQAEQKEILTISEDMPTDLRIYEEFANTVSDSGWLDWASVNTGPILYLRNTGPKGELTAKTPQELDLEFVDAEGVRWEPVDWERVTNNL